MTKFDVKTFAVSSLSAAALSALCIGAAVGPARAATAPATLAAWQQVVSDKVSASNDLGAARVGPGRVARIVIGLHFDAAGAFAGADLQQSSGLNGVDEEALSVARHTRYPALPAAYRGTPRTVELRLSVGAPDDVARHQAWPERPTTIARTEAPRATKG